MNKKAFMTFFSFVAFSILHAQSFQPINKNASPEARKLLSYLYSISGKQILAGQHNYNNDDRFSDSAFAFTGKYPQVWGNDFIWNGTQDNGQAIVDAAIKKSREGYFITLMWHRENQQMIHHLVGKKTYRES